MSSSSRFVTYELQPLTLPPHLSMPRKKGLGLLAVAKFIAFTGTHSLIVAIQSSMPSSHLYHIPRTSQSPDSYPIFLESEMELFRSRLGLSREPDATARDNTDVLQSLCPRPASSIHLRSPNTASLTRTANDHVFRQNRPSPRVAQQTPAKSSEVQRTNLRELPLPKGALRRQPADVQNMRGLSC